MKQSMLHLQSDVQYRKQMYFFLSDFYIYSVDDLVDLWNSTLTLAINTVVPRPSLPHQHWHRATWRS